MQRCRRQVDHISVDTLVAAWSLKKQARQWCGEQTSATATFLSSRACTIVHEAFLHGGESTVKKSAYIHRTQAKSFSNYIQIVCGAQAIMDGILLAVSHSCHKVQRNNTWELFNGSSWLSKCLAHRQRPRSCCLSPHRFTALSHTRPHSFATSKHISINKGSRLL